MLPAAETTISLLLAVAVYAALLGERHFEHSCFCRRGCITHCSEQQDSVLWHLVKIFLKMLKQSNL